MLLAILLACNSETNIPEQSEPDPTPGTATRPIVEPVDSALVEDTGGPTTDTETTDTAPPIPTAETGTPPIDTGIHILEGRTFRFDPGAPTIDAGGVGINLYESNFLVEVLNVSPTLGTAELRVASYDPNTGGQAPCAPTADIEADFSADPVMSFGPVDGTVGLFGKPAPIEQAEGQLQFDASNYERISNAEMAGLWDINNFASYYYGAGYGGTLCAVLGSYGGGGCTTCPTSGSTTCLPIITTNASARWESGMSLQERTEADVMADPSCF